VLAVLKMTSVLELNNKDSGAEITIIVENSDDVKSWSMMLETTSSEMKPRFLPSCNFF
jgi:hypothetical protein